MSEPRYIRDKTPWPRELMHAEACAWRFGATAKCDCGLEERLTEKEETNMATINSRAVVDRIIARDGWYDDEDQTQVVKIVEYRNDFNGGTAYGLIFRGMDRGSYHNAPACHNPVTIWETP